MIEYIIITKVMKTQNLSLPNYLYYILLLSLENIFMLSCLCFGKTAHWYAIVYLFLPLPFTNVTMVARN